VTGAVLLVAGLSATGIGALMGLLLLGGRLRRARRARAEAAVRPILFDAIDRGAPDGATFDALDPVEQRALEALARSLLPKLRGRDRDALARLLDLRGTVAVAHRHTRSRRASVRARAGEFLGQTGTAASVPDLVSLLRDANPRVRVAAARALGQLGDPAALSALLARVEGTHPLPVDVVADAVVAIRDCPVSILRQGSGSASVAMRALSVELLGRFQALAAADDVVEILRSDPSPEVRARAARCLGRMGSPRAVEPLVACLDGSPAPVRIQALSALGEIGAPEALPVLRATLLGPSRQLSEVAAGALEALGPPGLRLLEHVADGRGQAADAAATVLADRAAGKVASG